MPVAFGRTITGEIIPLLVDSNGNLLVVPADDSPVLAKLEGYYSGAWQKAPIPFGFSAPVSDVIFVLSLTATTQTADGTTVPTGELWCVTNITVGTNTAVASGYLNAAIIKSSTEVGLFRIPNPLAAYVYDRQGMWTIGEGDNLRLTISGGTVGANMFLTAYGYKIDVDL